MNEEEIIKMLKEYSATNPFQKNMFYVSNLHEAIQGLLDLYNKEKEKNKELETYNKKLDKENQGLFEAYNFNDTNLFAKTLKEYRKEILNSIPKSKVREKIEEAEEYEKEVKTIITVNGIYYVPSSVYYKIIQEGYKELLQEGDK